MGTAKVSIIVAVVAIALAFLPEQSVCWSRTAKAYVPCTTHLSTDRDRSNVQRQRAYRTATPDNTSRYQRWGR